MNGNSHICIKIRKKYPKILHLQPNYNLLPPNDIDVFFYRPLTKIRSEISKHFKKEKKKQNKNPSTPRHRSWVIDANCFFFYFKFNFFFFVVFIIQWQFWNKKILKYNLANKTKHPMLMCFAFCGPEVIHICRPHQMYSSETEGQTGREADL